MKMNELKLIYFSPTGTTHKVVMETARSIDLKSVSFDLTIKKDLKPVAKFAPNDFALFAIPVYYGRVPALFLKYLDLFSGNGTPAALVATYGCREYEDALLELKTEVEKRGFKVIGAAAFPAEHSIVNSIGARRPNKADLKEASEYGISLNRIIKKEDSFASESGWRKNRAHSRGDPRGVPAGRGLRFVLAGQGFRLCRSARGRRHRCRRSPRKNPGIFQRLEAESARCT